MTTTDDLDLSPRSSSDRGTRPRRPAITVVAVVLLGAAAFLVYQGLTNATLYFRNADVAVAQRHELGDRRFRLQGTVVAAAETEGGLTLFTVEHDDVQVDVRHAGDPPELFQAGIPVVAEGRWSSEGDWFDSDRILVKHTSEYEAENPDRVSPGLP